MKGAKKGREEIRSLGFLPFSPPPGIRIILLLAPSPTSLPLSPLPYSAGVGRRGCWLKPPPAAAWKSSSCHLPSGVRMAHFFKIPFGPRGRCGGWVRGAPCTQEPRQSRSRVAPHCGGRCAGHLRWAAASPEPRLPQPPRPPPAGGIHSLSVAKGGEKASAEVSEKPRRCWKGAWGSWK